MKKKLLILSIIILAAAIGYFVKYPIFGIGNPANEEDKKAQSQEENFLLKQPDLTMAVVIENSPEARPQFGLAPAPLVFETLAEGGITRLVAFYDDGDVARIGPVRSVRPYFVDWALGFGVPLVHSGGSWHALQKIQKLGKAFLDIDEFAYERYFWRDRSRAAPHNLFTSTKLIADVAKRNDWTLPATNYGWEVDSDLGSASTTVSEILIDYSFPIFQVLYKYNPANKNYQRFLAGQPHKDAASGNQITTDNVVVLYTTSAVLDPKPHFLTIDLASTGLGRAVLFRNGQIINGRWKKTSPTAILELLDADGTKLKLAPGSVWISVIDQSGTARWN